MTDYAIDVDETAFIERPVRFWMPSLYGIVTLREALQSFVHVRIGDAQGCTASVPHRLN